jgi:hypothetical protein
VRHRINHFHQNGLGVTPYRIRVAPHGLGFAPHGPGFAPHGPGFAPHGLGFAHYRMRERCMRQLVSQVLPSSVESACAQRTESGLMSVHR